MSNTGGYWFAALILTNTVLGAMYMRERNQNEVQQRLAACLTGKPKLAAALYSRRTPVEDKEAIMEGCLGGHAEYDARDDGR